MSGTQESTGLVTLQGSVNSLGFGWRDKHLGDLSSDGRTFLTRRGPPHYSWKMRGYGIQEGLLDQLQARAVRTINLAVTDEAGATVVYRVPPQAWRDRGAFATLNAQAGPQVFLTVDQLQAFRVAPAVPMGGAR